MSEPTRTARRTVLAASAAALAGSALTACGGGGEDEPSTEPGTAANPPATAPKALTSTADVPVGGGRVFKEEKVVVTQPTEGSFRCFTAVCTHQGCLVNKVENGTIDCPCHGSKFQIADGAPTGGPATRPLAEKNITVAPDGSISLA
ncbi:Rieske (2Fe-2S) protein [Streptomyces sp. NPDC003038]|uniref:Rieske (2Fe-2S) protein n=1 Tax=unclassified Streptomyces TaxID=2593676 RepID=UPI0033BE8EB0